MRINCPFLIIMEEEKEPVNKLAERYIKIVKWSDEDNTFVGSLPEICGECCDGDDPEAVMQQLHDIAVDAVNLLQDKLDGSELDTALDPVPDINTDTVLTEECDTCACKCWVDDGDGKPFCNIKHQDMYKNKEGCQYKHPIEKLDAIRKGTEAIIDDLIMKLHPLEVICYRRTNLNHGYVPASTEMKFRFGKIGLCDSGAVSFSPSDGCATNSAFLDSNALLLLADAVRALVQLRK